MTADGHVIVKPRTLRVSIPAGVTDGQQIRLAGQGSPGLGGGPPGDLLLEVTIRPHPLSGSRAATSRSTLPVAPWEAALGETVSVPTLGGPVDMKLPAGRACRPEAAAARPGPAGPSARRPARAARDRAAARFAAIAAAVRADEARGPVRPARRLPVSEATAMTKLDRIFEGQPLDESAWLEVGEFCAWLQRRAALGRESRRGGRARAARCSAGVLVVPGERPRARARDGAAGTTST